MHHVHLQLSTLLAEGRHSEAVSLLLGSSPPSASWQPQKGRQQQAAATIVVAVQADTADACSIPPTANHEDMHQEQEEEQELKLWQSQCSKLQAWAVKSLQQVMPDLGMSALHDQLLKQVAVAAVSGSGAGKSRIQAWWRLPPVASSSSSSDAASQACQLAGAVHHLACSSDQAWVKLAQALWHGLAMDVQGGKLRQGVQHHWSPTSATKRLVDLQAKQAEQIKQLLSQMPCSATLGVELSEAGHALLPRTYLQLVGQKLLGRATTTLPVLASLPEPPPDWFVRGLFTAPFAEALRLALSDILSAPDGDASPYIPQLQQQPAAAGGFRRIYPSHAAGANMAAAAAAAAREPSALFGGGRSGSRGFMWHVGNRALLGVLVCVFRDVQEYEAGLLLAVPDGDSASMQQLARCLTGDLQAVLAGCRRQLRELLLSSTTQLLLNTLEEELQQPLHDLLQSAADVTPDLWPPLSTCPAEQPGSSVTNTVTNSVSNNNTSASGKGSSLPAVRGALDSSSPNEPQACSTSLSIFGSSSLWVCDSRGVWGLGSAGRGAAARNGRRNSCSSMAYMGQGISGSFSGRCGGSVAGGFDPPASRLVSRSGGSNPACGTAAAGWGSGVQQQQQQGLSQPQQVTQGQQRLLVFVGACLARRHHFPLQVQDLLVEALIAALSAVMQATAAMAAPSNALQHCNQDTTGHLCCCISMALCIQRRLLWLREVLTCGGPNGQEQQDSSSTVGPQQDSIGPHQGNDASKTEPLAQQSGGLPQQVLQQQLQQSIEQAASLVSALHSALTSQLLDTHSWSVLAAVAGRPWGSSRPPPVRPAAVRPGDSSSKQGNRCLLGWRTCSRARWNGSRSGAAAEAASSSRPGSRAGSRGGATAEAASSSRAGSRASSRNGAAAEAAAGAAAAAAIAASPGVRLWHMQLQAWLYVLRRVLPPNMAADIMGQVTLQSCRSLVQLYLSLHPSPPWLAVLQQDVAAIATTAWEFSQPLQVLQQPQQQQGLEEQCLAVHLPPELVSELSALCKELVVHSAQLAQQQAAGAAASTGPSHEAAPQGCAAAAAAVAGVMNVPQLVVLGSPIRHEQQQQQQQGLAGALLAVAPPDQHIQQSHGFSSSYSSYSIGRGIAGAPVSSSG